MVAAMLGKPLMAWQQYALDVILEIDPDTGELAYDEYRLTVPRQSGKSTLILAKSVHRCSAGKFFGGRQSMVYLAQTRKDSRKKFEKDYAPNLEAPAARRFKAHPHWANGNEHFSFPNGSWFGIEANTEKSGHGETLDEAILDEAFAQVDNRAEQAVGPAMITRRNKQLGIISTMGWSDASPYLMEKVRDGRRLVELQLVDRSACRGVAYFEWSAPDDADPGDEQVWLDCMPAVHRPECGRGCRDHTITLQAIRSEFEKAQRSGKLSDFRRAYLNQAVSKPREGEETALGNWAACGLDIAPADVPPVVALGVAVERDREWSSICYAGLLELGEDEGGRTVPLVAPVTDGRRPGVDWLAAEAARISIERQVPVVVDVGGTAGEQVAVDIEAAGGRVLRAKLPEYVTACAEMYDRVHERTMRHVRSPVLNESVVGARWRSAGDGKRVFGRRQSEGDVSTLIAATLAMWGAKQGGSVYEGRGMRFL
jgi:hypothetical protein